MLCSNTCLRQVVSFFFFNDTATTEIYTLSLHDALPISREARRTVPRRARASVAGSRACRRSSRSTRSEEHTSELQSQSNLVCRLLLEKKKKITEKLTHTYTPRSRIPDISQVVYHYQTPH